VIFVGQAPVWDLLDSKGLGTTTFPPIGTLIDRVTSPSASTRMGTRLRRIGPTSSNSQIKNSTSAEVASRLHLLHDGSSDEIYQVFPSSGFGLCHMVDGFHTLSQHHYPFEVCRNLSIPCGR
jgi:hypothetical protein